jgi:protein SCO1/2
VICSTTIRKLAVGAVFALCTSVGAWSQAQPKYALQGDGSTNQKLSIFDKVGFDQRLNQKIPLDLTFLDENGQQVQLKRYFGSKPVILSLVYFQCPMLCSQVLNGMAGAFNGIRRFDVGRDFNVITVSFDPRDTPEAAAQSKKTYLERYRRPGAAQGWHFLTGKKEQIDALANAVGFHFAWDPQINQFAHASGIMLLTPDGRLAQYYYGIEYAPRDLQFGLIQSSQGKIGNIVDKVILYCYEYDPARGKYGAVVFRILRLSALATVLVLGGFMVIMFRRDILTARQNRSTRTAE